MTRRLARVLPLAALAVLSAGSGYNSPPRPQDGPPPPPPSGVGIDQRLGERVPFHLPFKDEAGNQLTLGDCTAGKPAVLVLAYYRCPMLCTQVLNGLVKAMRALPESAGGEYSLVVVSIDPREKPPLAAMKKANFAQEYGRPGADAGCHFLTGDPLAVAALADAVGFRYEYDRESEQYAHASGLAVLAPDGTICRYLLGVRFEPRDLRFALTEASGGKVGSPAEQVLLLCYRYDPATGRYTFAILRVVKWASGVAVAGIAGLVGMLIWKGRKRSPPAPPPAAEG